MEKQEKRPYVGSTEFLLKQIDLLNQIIENDSIVLQSLLKDYEDLTERYERLVNKLNDYETQKKKN